MGNPLISRIFPDQSCFSDLQSSARLGRVGSSFSAKFSAAFDDIYGAVGKCQSPCTLLRAEACATRAPPPQQEVISSTHRCVKPKRVGIGGFFVESLRPRSRSYPPKVHVSSLLETSILTAMRHFDLRYGGLGILWLDNQGSEIQPAQRQETNDFWHAKTRRFGSCQPRMAQFCPTGSGVFFISSAIRLPSPIPHRIITRLVERSRTQTRLRQ